MKIVLAGGTGQIGTLLARAFLGQFGPEDGRLEGCEGRAGPKAAARSGSN